MKSKLRRASLSSTSSRWRDVDVVVLCPDVEFVLAIYCEVIGYEPMLRNIVVLQDSAVVVPWINASLIRHEVRSRCLTSAISNCSVMGIAVRNRLGLHEVGPVVASAPSSSSICDELGGRTSN